ncbi:MAG: hypothetical protein ABJL99_06950 [Aliishimia sp.]
MHFSLTGEHAGYSFTYGQSRFFVFGGRAYDLEWIADISPTSRHGDGDVPSYLTANGFSSRAKTSRLGLGLRRVFANTDFARLSSAVELGLSHTSLRINYLGESIHGSDTSTYAAISLRADTVYDRKNRLWIDLRYVTSPATSIPSHAGRLHHETSEAQFRFGLTLDLE